MSDWVSVEGAFEGRRERRKRRRRKERPWSEKACSAYARLGDVFQVLGGEGQSARVRPKLS